MGECCRRSSHIGLPTTKSLLDLKRFFYDFYDILFYRLILRTPKRPQHTSSTKVQECEVPKTDALLSCLPQVFPRTRQTTAPHRAQAYTCEPFPPIPSFPFNALTSHKTERSSCNTACRNSGTVVLPLRRTSTPRHILPHSVGAGRPSLCLPTTSPEQAGKVHASGRAAATRSHGLGSFSPISVPCPFPAWASWRPERG
jgi:hypothetical protein